MNQTCFQNVEEWSETNITGNNSFQWYFLNLSQVNWADIEIVKFLPKEMPDIKIDDYCLFQVERRLNVHLKSNKLEQLQNQHAEKLVKDGTIATPPGFHRSTNRRHATQQNGKHHFCHAQHHRLSRYGIEDCLQSRRPKFNAYSENISIVGVMQKRSDLSDVPKGRIIGFRAKGGSISETAEFVNCSRAAVVKVYRAWQNGTVQNQ
ncbi:uncharacterized protein TNCV_4593771 [Trichonephila clavipes]|uniref:Uncharacterized protein n=1 Tax=Trichonephila clavipes TaxID=2585209 RepID=A0A8X6WF40_TRICX|nr:uncharacterized protein TNCV_4593771 [Trichonephila clavipes]